MPVGQQPSEPGWEAWSRGEGRCPYCVDMPWREFEAMCDCWEVDREIAARAELRFLEVEALEDLMAEPTGGHNHGRKKSPEGGWQAMETDPRDTPSRKRESVLTPHGTDYAYRKLKCRCPECRAWKANQDKGRKR